MASNLLFPALFLCDFKKNPEDDEVNVGLVPTCWLRCSERRIVLPINSGIDQSGVCLGYWVFEGTGIIHSGLEAYRLAEMRLDQPSDLPLVTYPEVFARSGRQQCVKDFLTGIVPHA